jgi:hypothetical protein
MKNFLQFTINVRKSHRQQQWTLQFVREERVSFVGVDRHFFFNAGSSIPNAIGQSASRIHVYFVKFTLNPTPQIKI